MEAEFLLAEGVRFGVNRGHLTTEQAVTNVAILVNSFVFAQRIVKIFLRSKESRRLISPRIGCC
jgi:hypothetical protein